MNVRRLEDQVALVTGAASGIGLATADALAKEGAHIAVIDRDARGVDQAAKALEQAGGTARPYIVDLSDASAIGPVVTSVLADFGRINVLVNCAGVSGAPHSVLDFSDEKYEFVTNVNLRAPFVLTREVGTHMVERDGGGRIVNVSSSAAFRATSSPAIYAATKAGINALTRTSAADLGPYGINVNAVAPGVTRTAIIAGMGDAAALERAVTSGPMANLLHRVSEPEDVANVIVFLCLPESRQITGQVINTSAGLVV